MGWPWEYDDDFDQRLQQHRNSEGSTYNWVDSNGNPVLVSGGMANLSQAEKVEKVKIGVALGSPHELIYRDTSSFRAGELHAHVDDWVDIIGDNPIPQQMRVLDWIRNLTRERSRENVTNLIDPR